MFDLFSDFSDFSSSGKTVLSGSLSSAVSLDCFESSTVSASGSTLCSGAGSPDSGKVSWDSDVLNFESSLSKTGFSGLSIFASAEILSISESVFNLLFLRTRLLGVATTSSSSTLDLVEIVTTLDFFAVLEFFDLISCFRFLFSGPQTNLP